MTGSAHDWRGYLGVIFVATALLVLAAWALIEAHRTEHELTDPHHVLLTHQLQKLAAPPPRTLFLGDSSLGNAISAEYWRDLSGHSASNLALTGSFGYAGSYNFLRRALEQGQPTNVVLMHTSDVLARAVSERGFELTRPHPRLLDRFAVYWQETMNFTRLVRAARALISNRIGLKLDAQRQRPQLLRDDYIMQGPALTPSRQQSTLLVRQLRPDNLKYLRLVAELCRERHVNCLYVHGPLARLTCDASTEFLAVTSELIKAAGPPLVHDLPLCLDPEEIGDSIDHVRPSHKLRLTERYFDLLRPFLK